MCSEQFYAVRSMVSGDGYQGVWGYHVDDDISMERWPLDFVGIADVMESRDGQWVNIDTQIVGIELVNGAFHVLPKLPCFHGIVRENATHEQSICCQRIGDHAPFSQQWPQSATLRN